MGSDDLCYLEPIAPTEQLLTNVSLKEACYLGDLFSVFVHNHFKGGTMHLKYVLLPLKPYKQVFVENTDDSLK